MSVPAKGRRKRAMTLRALLPCLALVAFDKSPGWAQAITSDLFRPVRDGFVLAQDSPLRRTGDSTDDADDDRRLREKNAPAPSRIGRISTLRLSPASGGADTGFDSLNRGRKRRKFYPAQVKPKPPPGPGSPAPVTSSRPLRP